MITVTLTFNTSEEALAALKKLEGTAAEPAAKLKGALSGESAPQGEVHTSLTADGISSPHAPLSFVPQGKVHTSPTAEENVRTPPTAAADGVPAKKGTGSAARLDFKRDLVPPFLALATKADGPAKQREVLAAFKVDRLSAVPADKYPAVLEHILGLSS